MILIRWKFVKPEPAGAYVKTVNKCCSFEVKREQQHSMTATRQHVSPKEETMIIKSCLDCKYHMVREEAKEQTSYCGRENCWSRLARCIEMKALERFLKQESTDYDCFSPTSVSASK